MCMSTRIDKIKPKFSMVDAAFVRSAFTKNASDLPMGGLRNSLS